MLNRNKCYGTLKFNLKAFRFNSDVMNIFTMEIKGTSLKSHFKKCSLLTNWPNDEAISFHPLSQFKRKDSKALASVEYRSTFFLQKEIAIRICLWPGNIFQSPDFAPIKRSNCNNSKPPSPKRKCYKWHGHWVWLKIGPSQAIWAVSKVSIRSIWAADGRQTFKMKEICLSCKPESPRKLWKSG